MSTRDATYEQAIRDLETAQRQNARYVAALAKIAEGKGRFSLDPLRFASNTVEDMKEIARNALAIDSQSPATDETP